MKKFIRQNTKMSMLAALLCIAAMIASIFLPYMTAEDEYAEFLEAADQPNSLSLFTFAKMFVEQDIPAFAAVLGIFVGLMVIAALLAVCRKPIGVMFFDILITAAAALIRFIFGHDATMANGFYVWGIADKLIFVACAGLLVSAIWMLMVKKSPKKEVLASNEI